MLGLLVAMLAAPVNVAPVGGGNALTLPAARHLVRLETPGGRATWLLAVQQDGAAGHWLSFYRSDDEARTWHWYAPIQDACCERDTPDLVQVGMDVAVLFSYEGPDILGSTAHDVWFQWWRWNGAADWTPQPAVRVFDSTSSATAYHRGELAVDSQGRLWVWAARLNSDGTFTLVLSMSADGGKTFQAQPSLDTFAARPGGRIIPVAGNQLMLLYGTHATDPGFMRLRNDSDPPGTWGARQVVFPEGIYHGAALSAAGDGSGGVHLVYKDVGEQLWYRHWSGSWSSRQLVESSADWALQPAVTRVGGALVIFWNRMLTSGFDYQFFYRTLSGGTLGPAQQLAGSGGFKGYPASAEALPATVPAIPCFYGSTADASVGGSVALVFAPTPGAVAPPPPPPPSPPPPPPPQSGTLFSDDFNRTTGMGAGWSVLSGSWLTPGANAQSNLDGGDQVAVRGLSCADCTVQARVVHFGTNAALDLREGATGDRYDVLLTSNLHLQIRRWRGGVATVLGDVPSGVPDIWTVAGISLTATGAGPVQLVASVNGAARLSVSDTSASAIVDAGTAGMSTSVAGVVFDDFIVTGNAAGGGADGGVPDAGSPDAGAPPPDAGAPDAGAPSPDAGVPDAGVPDAGAPPPPPSGLLFTDDFTRLLSSGLGPDWTVVAGAWRDDNRANSDRNLLDRATVNGITCADCRIDATMVNFGGGEAMLELRVSGSSRYALALTTSGRLELRRYGGTAATVLGAVASGIPDLTAKHTFSLAVSGTGPVTLVGSVDGVPRLSVTDSGAAALTGAGQAGIAATVAGIVIDDFRLTGAGATSAPPPPDAGLPDAGAPDAGAPPPDAGTPPPDAGVPPPDAGLPDAGAPDAGPADGGTSLAATVTWTETNFDLMAVDPAGTAYGVSLAAGDAQVFASVDGRFWSQRSASTTGSFRVMTALSDGTLLADVAGSAGRAISRSTDHGVTWKDVLVTGAFRALTPHSFAELDGAVYYVEYQVFTTASTPIRLWKSLDGGATWSVKFTFQGHRHAHGLMPDPARHALFAFFGDFDAQSGLYRSTDGGASWALIKGGTQAGDIVDGAVLADGSFLCGQDISFVGSTPDKPQIARIALNGVETDYVTLPSASYSTHAVSGGGFVVGATHEEGADVEAPGWNRGSLWGSGDGVHWTQLLTVPQANPNDDVRADVYWELSTGELVLSVRNAAGFGADGRGYLLLHTTRQ